MPEKDSTISQLHHPSDKKERHGLHKSRTYDIWQAMRQRIHNPKRNCYERYGGRGITIDPRWDSFATFLEDMGKAPPLHSLDRKDTNGNYCKDNCKWSTASEQQRNRRDNRMLTFKEQRKTIWEWSEITGIGVQVIATRIKKNWDAERILTTPVEAKFSHAGRVITFNGETRTGAGWARVTGIPQPTISWRLNRNWPIAKVLGFKDQTQ